MIPTLTILIYAVVEVYFPDQGIIKVLFSLQFIQKSVCGEELARELISTLSVMLGIKSGMLVGAMHDRASVNSVAMCTVCIMYPSVLDIGCMSHAFDCVGENFKTPNLDTFFTLWISLFAHSQSAKALWRERTNRAMASYSKTRWWSRWEVMHQILQQFGDVEPFLRATSVSPSTCNKLLKILSDPQQIALVKFELAAVIDIGSYFVKGTYNLEGDSLLAVRCYDEVLGSAHA